MNATNWQITRDCYIPRYVRCLYSCPVEMREYVSGYRITGGNTN